MASDRNDNSDKPLSALERYLAKQKAEKAAREPAKPEKGKGPLFSDLKAKAEQKAKEYAASKASQKAAPPPPDPRAKPTYGKGERPSLAGIERPEPVQPPSLSRWERVAESRLSEDEKRAQEAGAPAAPPRPSVLGETIYREPAALDRQAGDPIYRVPVDEWRPITDTATSSDGIQNASFAPRFIAAIIDSVILWTLTWIAKMPVMAALSIIVGSSMRKNLDGFEILVSLAALYAYYGYFYSLRGASPGKLMLGLEVTGVDGVTRLTPWQAFLREAIGKAVSTIPFLMGFVIVLIRHDHRALHDLLFDTRVVRKKPIV